MTATTDFHVVAALDPLGRVLGHRVAARRRRNCGLPLGPTPGSRSFAPDRRGRCGVDRVLRCGPDGTWLRAIFNNTDPDAFDRTTGNPLRLDPDAVPFHYTTTAASPQPPGHLLVMLLARTPYAQERIILDHYIKNPHLGPKSDATIAVDLVLDLYSTYKDKLKDALRGLAYDMALRSEDHDRLLDAGLLGISQTPKKSKKRLASAYLGPHTFTKTDGTEAKISITAINGIPTIEWIDGDGERWCIPLKRKQTKHSEPSDDTVIYNICSIPDDELLPQKLHNATALIRLNSTSEERRRKPHKRRTRALRAIPKGDPDFQPLYGRRQDSESENRTLKRHMPDKRCKTFTRTYVDYGMFGYRLYRLVVALSAFRKRTGGETQHLVRQTLRTRLNTAPPQQTRHKAPQGQTNAEPHPQLNAQPGKSGAQHPNQPRNSRLKPHKTVKSEFRTILRTRPRPRSSGDRASVS